MSPAQKPPARVRRVLDVEPLEPREQQFRVRPFLEYFDRGAGLSPLVIKGELCAGELVISVSGGAPVALRAAPRESGAESHGTDLHGSFAWVAAQEHRMGDAHALRVEADAHDVDESPAVITYFELASDAVASLETAYAERWYSIHFNPLGLVDGTSSAQPRSLRAPPLSS